MWKVRSAQLEEAEDLTKLAAESESYWSYDDEFIEVYKIIYDISVEEISKNPTYVLEDGEVIGFYSVIQEGYLGILDYFYIKPGYMGKGYGRIMWNHMIDLCDNLGIVEIEIVTTPPSKSFFTKMGAVVIKEISSEVDDRKIPKLIYKIKANKKILSKV